MGSSLGLAVRAGAASAAGFTLVETIVASFVAGIVLLAFYASLATGFSIIRVTQENLRATQIMVQRMEAIRLSAYTALQDPAKYPTSFTEYYSESGKTTGKGGAAYTVTYTCSPAPTSLPPSYRTNVLAIKVEASWKSGTVRRSRSMQTYVARYGIQRYVCGG
jgi:prepilin-type N-terminal cleavage/methylation domain-containing protein